MDAYTSNAITAFQEVERVRLLLDKKEQALLFAVRAMALKSDEDSKAEYFDETTKILDEYETKRDRAGLI